MTEDKEKKILSLKDRCKIKTSLLLAQGNLKPELLPPTADAAQLHGLRVYLQIQAWKTLAEDLNPAGWGWVDIAGAWAPVAMISAIAPDDILQMTTCACKKSGCKEGSRCSCVTNQVACLMACKHCHGLPEDCLNPFNPVL